MDELKPCRCGGHAKLWTSPAGDFISCDNCKFTISYFDKFDDERLIEEWNRRTAPENKPLTLDQLRQMDNQLVWTDRRCGVVRADPQITRRPGMPVIYFNYGWEWADDVLKCGPVYARKPEEEK